VSTIHLSIIQLHERLGRVRERAPSGLAGDEVLALWLALRQTSVARLARVERAASECLGGDVEAVGRDELIARLGRGDVVLVDVRPREEFEGAHIDGARSIPLDELHQRLAELPAGHEVVAYCRGPFCAFANEAVRRLRAAGRDAWRLEEGWPGWRLADKPHDVGEPRDRSGGRLRAIDCPCGHHSRAPTTTRGWVSPASTSAATTRRRSRVGEVMAVTWDDAGSRTQLSRPTPGSLLPGAGVHDAHARVAVVDEDRGVVERRGPFDGGALGLGLVGVLRQRGVEPVRMDDPDTLRGAPDMDEMGRHRCGGSQASSDWTVGGRPPTRLWREAVPAVSDQGVGDRR
jgi:rhodanese-related sulfurtransferase